MGMGVVFSAAKAEMHVEVDKSHKTKNDAHFARRQTFLRLRRKKILMAPTLGDPLDSPLLKRRLAEGLPVNTTRTLGAPSSTTGHASSQPVTHPASHASRISWNPRLTGRSLGLFPNEVRRTYVDSRLDPRHRRLVGERAYLNLLMNS